MTTPPFEGHPRAFLELQLVVYSEDLGISGTAHVIPCAKLPFVHGSVSSPAKDMAATTPVGGPYTKGGAMMSAVKVFIFAPADPTEEVHKVLQGQRYELHLDKAS